MESLQELRMRRIELQEQLARVTLQIDRLEAVEYREWSKARHAALNERLPALAPTQSLFRCREGSTAW